MKIFYPPKKRIFLVGCPRSGTTLLQSLLTAHSQITSFPESHFFRYLIPDRNSKRYSLGIASPKAKPRFEAFLKEINREDMSSYLSDFTIFQYQYIQAFLNILDIITQEQGKTIWIEKTPGHIHYIDYIEKQIKETRFIHIIRNGADVVASLYEVTKKYPNLWGHSWTLDKCINQWIKDVQISLKYQERSNHIVVHYENLVKNPALVLNQICEFINIKFEPVMLENYHQNTKVIVLENEPWKTSVGDTIRNRNGQKFDKLFAPEQKSYILKNLSEVMSKLNY